MATAHVIKAGDRPGAMNSARFNFDDLSAQAAQYLQEVRREAGKIIEQAKQEGERLRQQAEQAGFQAGQQRMAAMVNEEVGKRMQTLTPALQAAVSEIQQSKQTWLAHWEKSAVDLAMRMAERVCRHQAERNPEVTLALVREGLQLAAGSADLQLMLNPEDQKALGQQAEVLVAQLSGVTSAKVSADPKVSRGGCRIETRFGRIDQTFEAQLARIAEELCA